MTVYIAAPRRYYVFGGVCSLAATTLIRASGVSWGMPVTGILSGIAAIATFLSALEVGD